VEFNRNFEPGCFATFPDPTGTKPHVWGGSEGGSGVEDMVMGASLDAMDLLARQHGYVVGLYKYDEFSLTHSLKALSFNQPLKLGVVQVLINH
jgi:hypothetical protein